MAQRTIWQVQLSGGMDTRYVVLGRTPNEAVQRGWALDKDHQSHAERTSIHVSVAGSFMDVENDIPQTAEDQLRADLASVAARLEALEARSTATAAGGR